MNINTVTFVAPNLACGEARGGRIPAVGCNRRATKPQAKLGATSGRQFFLAQASLLAPLRPLKVWSSLAPRLRQKSLAANVTVFMFMTTKQKSRFDGPNS